MINTQQFTAVLSARSAAVNQALAAFAQQLLQETAKEEPFTRAAVQSYLSLLSRGGKRLRGILVLTGFELYGGKDKEIAHQAAVVIEACHAYLLVMDDVADNSDRRRNGPAAHIDMVAFISQHGLPAGEAAKKGTDMAQTAALYAQHKAQSLLLELELPAKRKVLAATVLNQGLARTGIGQLRDISPLDYGDLTHEDILQIAIYKTAYYSFLLPLQLGAALAGAGEDELTVFEMYSLNAGLAFQLHDDIIGTFGDEATTGKPRMSDIIEGKKTMMMAKAFEKATPADKKVLLTALGNPALQQEQFEQCLAIIRQNGALDHTRVLAARYAEQAVSALDAAPPHWAPEEVQFLQRLAHYSVSRDI